METNEIYSKTALGQAEIESSEQQLSLIERRVLILVNGEKDIATLARLSLCDDAAAILEGLLDRGFVERSEIKQPERASKAQSADEDDIGARDFMCNTLLTYGNRVRVSKLIDKIRAVEDIESFKSLVDPWYQAISETPGGMYEADKLRDQLLKQVGTEEASGLR